MYHIQNSNVLKSPLNLVQIPFLFLSVGLNLYLFYYKLKCNSTCILIYYVWLIISNYRMSQNIIAKLFSNVKIHAIS